MKKLNIAILILFCVLTILLISCDGIKMTKDKNSSDEKIRYFGGFVGKSHPIIPYNEIRKEDTLSRRAYCVANYNDMGQITTFKKISNSKFFFLFEYEYYKNGKIKRAKITNADGEIIILNF